MNSTSVGVVVIGLDLAESHGAEPALRGGQRHHAERANLLAAADISMTPGKELSACDVGDDEGLLGFEDAAGGRFADGQFDARRGCVARAASVSRMCRRMTCRSGSCRIEIQVVEMGDVVQPRGQFVEELGQIAVMSDGFRDFEQGLRARGRRFSRGSWR